MDKSIIQRLEQWQRHLNVDISVISDLDSIEDPDLRNAVTRERSPKQVWYDRDSGYSKLIIFAPNIPMEFGDHRELDNAIVCETIAQKGFGPLLRSRYDDFCQNVWSNIDTRTRLAVNFRINKDLYTACTPLVGGRATIKHAYLENYLESPEMHDIISSHMFDQLKKSGIYIVRNYGNTAKRISFAANIFGSRDLKEKLGKETTEELNRNIINTLKSSWGLETWAIPEKVQLFFGFPSEMMLNCGFRNNVVTMSLRNMISHMRKHNISIEDMERINLVKAITEPLVFTKGKEGRILSTSFDTIKVTEDGFRENVSAIFSTQDQYHNRNIICSIHPKNEMALVDKIYFTDTKENELRRDNIIIGVRPEFFDDFIPKIAKRMNTSVARRKESEPDVINPDVRLNHVAKLAKKIYSSKPESTNTVRWKIFPGIDKHHKRPAFLRKEARGVIRNAFIMLFDDIQKASNNCCVASVNGGYILANLESGKIVNDTIYKKVFPMTSDGWAHIIEDEEKSQGRLPHNFIDKNGKMLSSTGFSNAKSFHNGKASVEYKGMKCHVDTLGNITRDDDSKGGPAINEEQTFRKRR